MLLVYYRLVADIVFAHNRYLQVLNSSWLSVTVVLLIIKTITLLSTTAM